MGWSRIQNGGPPSAQGGLYGELSTGNRDRGALKKRYKDCLKTSLNVWHIDCLQWSDMVPHRDAWRDTVHKPASQFEENRRDSLKNKRQRRKAQAASTTKNPDLTYMCRHCTRTCLSRIGLLSHERASSRRGQQPSWSSFAKPSQTTIPAAVIVKVLFPDFFFLRMKLQTSFAIRIGRKIVPRESHLSLIW